MTVLRLGDDAKFINEDFKEFSIEKRKRNNIKKVKIKKISGLEDLEIVNEELLFKMIPKDYIKETNVIPVIILVLETGDSIILQAISDVCLLQYDHKTDKIKRVEIKELELGDEVMAYNDEDLIITEIADIIIAESQQNELYFSDLSDEEMDEDRLSRYVIETEKPMIVNGIVIG